MTLENNVKILNILEKNFPLEGKQYKLTVN